MWAFLLPMIMQAISSYGQNEAAEDVIERRNQLNTLESERQDEFQKRAEDINLGTQDEFTRANQQKTLAESFQNRAGTIRQEAPSEASYSAPKSAGPSVVGNEIARKVAQAAKFSGKQGDALARLRSYSDLGNENQLALAEGAQQLGGVGRDARRSSEILPIELQNAESAGDTWRRFADLMRLGGTAAGIYGMTGGFGNAARPIQQYTTPVGGAPRLRPPM